MSSLASGNVSPAGLSRRGLLKASAAIAAGATLPAAGQALAQAKVTLKGYGIATSALKDWSLMEKAIGVGMDYTPVNGNIGAFMRDIIANKLDQTYDLFFFEPGTHELLGKQGIYAEIDTKNPALTLWSRTPDFWRNSDITMADGKIYGVPILGNGDSFGYNPKAVGANPNGQDTLSWSLMFEDPRTKGRVSLDRLFTLSMAEMANYLSASGRLTVQDPANLTGEQAKAVADFAIERKRAGQFRTLHTSFEEQVQLLVNREVDVINCWEPAVKEAARTLGDDSIRYAFTDQGYYKWGHGVYVSANSIKNGKTDAIYKVLNFVLGGEFRAYQAIDRGYAGPNMDLGVEYATQHQWPAAQVEMIKATAARVDRKLQKPFWGKPGADNAAIMEEEWQRFLNA